MTKIDLLGRHSIAAMNGGAMNRISPTVLGILVVVGGVCAALPFQRRASRHVSIEPAKKSNIEWRSNDFTLEVIAHDLPLTDSPYDHDRVSSPAFGDANGTTRNSLASLDDVTQPPALAGAYETDPAVAVKDARIPPESGDRSRTTQTIKDAFTTAAATRLHSVAITHKIIDGDTLEALAEAHLGSRSRWTEIYNANPELLDNPEVLPLGVTIVILPGIRQSTPLRSDETELLVPVRGSDLLKFRPATN